MCCDGCPASYHVKCMRRLNLPPIPPPRDNGKAKAKTKGKAKEKGKAKPKGNSKDKGKDKGIDKSVDSTSEETGLSGRWFCAHHRCEDCDRNARVFKFGHGVYHIANPPLFALLPSPP